MNIDTAVKKYAFFLNNAWQVVLPLLQEREYTSDESSISDWLQANWELLVERKILNINEYLEVYGEGADFNGDSSRITDVNALPDFSIKATSVSGEKIQNLLYEDFCNVDDLKFDKLVGFDNGFYKLEPEFNFVLMFNSSGEEKVFALEEIKFELLKL